MYMSIHWSVCWLKKTENKWFDDGFFLLNFDHFVVVYKKMIIDFKVALLPNYYLV